jgi:hypothetical protein
MAQITVYVNYVIFFQDQAEYQAAVAVAGSPILEICPADAAALFGIPYNPLPSGDIALIPKGMYTTPPYSNLEPPGSEIGFPSPSGIFMDPTVGSVLVPGQAGNPPSIFPAGPDGLHVWSATLIHFQGAGSGITPPANNISQRRWVCGFEHSSELDGSSGNATPDFSRDASRVMDGCGLRAGGPNNRFMTNTMVMLRAGLVPQTHWDRFYFRARVPPPASTSDVGFWRVTCSAGASMGAQLIYQSTGSVKLFNINNAGTYFDKGVVFTPVVGQWYRFDVLSRSGSFPTTNGVVQVYINGVFALGFTDNTGEGISTGTNIVSIIFGQQFVNTNLAEIDFDDWIGADIPANMNPLTLTFNDTNYPIDWLLGSHVRRVVSNSASLTNWTPNSFGSLNQDINPSREATLTGVTLVSSTALAQIDGLTDAPLQSNQDRPPGFVLGAAAAVISHYGRNSGASDGQLGYRKAGGAVTQVTINQFGSNTNSFMGYLPTGMDIPDEIAPFSVIHTKSNDGNTDTTVATVACVEYLGLWGPEDAPDITIPMDRTLIHNCNYPNTQYGFWPSFPSGAQFNVGGTYVGNGTTQNIILPSAFHFVYIRNTSTSAGCLWLATSLGAMRQNNDVLPVIRAYFDSATAQFKLQINSADSMINQNGITYQYIVFCDPDARFNMCGAFNHPFAAPTPQVNTIPQPGFTAEFGIIQDNLVQSGGFTGNGLYIKGPGIGSNTMIRLDGAGNIANGCNFGIGVLNTFNGVHFMAGNKSNTAYSLWRTNDSGVGGCANIMVQLTTYVGNGVNPRNIPLVPISGRFPLFVWVQASGGNGIFRDPSHAGNNSATSSNFGNTTTGITAVAVDQITVQSSINANGVTYTVFALCGDHASMANGIYWPTYCVPPGGTPPSPPLADIIIIGDGGLEFNGDAPRLMLQDVGGIYTLVPGKLNDTLQDTQSGQPSVDVPILPVAKTGYIGG